MAAIPYRAVSFKPYELLTDDALNQNASNIQWLFENTPRVLYTTNRLKRAEGVRIACGRAAFEKKNNDQASQAVHFNNFFSQGCQPIITTGIVSTGQRKIFCTMSGLGQLHPTNQGFRLQVEVAATVQKYDKIAKQFWVTWMAMGY
jgi:hypothetical protein